MRVDWSGGAGRAAGPAGGAETGRPTPPALPRPRPQGGHRPHTDQAGREAAGGPGGHVRARNSAGIDR